MTSQKEVIIQDSFLIIDYYRATKIEERTKNLKKQIEILSKYVIACDSLSEKATKQELWCDREVAKWKTMDSIHSEKLTLSMNIMDNYDKLLILARNDLKISEKQRKKESLWKNIYKPIALGSVLYLTLSILVK